MIREIQGDFLQWLRGFFYVAKMRSITLATSEMNRNQPTISHQIKALENEFNTTLFDRSGGRMELTPEGEVLLEKTISLFEIIKEMRNEVSENRLQSKGDVKIVSSHAIIDYFLPTYIIDFRKRYPGVHFEIEGGGSRTILEKVESSEADFGIASLEVIPENMTYYDLFDTSLKLITPRGNPFSFGKKLTLKKIAEAPFIFFPRSSTITPLILKTFSEKGLSLNVMMILNNFEIVKRYVSLGVGVSILDDYTIEDKDREQLDVYPLDPFFEKRKYVILLRKRKYLSPPVKAFLKAIKPGIVNSGV